MAQDPNWARWIKSSVNLWFKNGIAAVSPDSYLYYEGQDRDTSKLQDWAELRLMGPWMREQSQNYWQFEVRLNLFIANALDATDLYKQERLQGLYLPIFGNTIPVFRLGTGEFDDQSLMECLQLSPKDQIQVYDFGIVNTTDHVTRLQQSAIQAKYCMYFRIPLG